MTGSRSIRRRTALAIESIALVPLTWLKTERHRHAIMNLPDSHIAQDDTEDA